MKVDNAKLKVFKTNTEVKREPVEIMPFIQDVNKLKNVEFVTEKIGEYKLFAIGKSIPEAISLSVNKDELNEVAYINYGALNCLIPVFLYVSRFKSNLEKADLQDACQDVLLQASLYTLSHPDEIIIEVAKCETEVNKSIVKYERFLTKSYTDFAIRYMSKPLEESLYAMLYYICENSGVTAEQTQHLKNALLLNYCSNDLEANKKIVELKAVKLADDSCSFYAYLKDGIKKEIEDSYDWVLLSNHNQKIVETPLNA